MCRPPGCVLLLPCIILIAGADYQVNHNLNFGGGSSKELDPRRACVKYIGEGYEICEKKQSGDCNKYAFSHDDSLYACQNDNLSGVCRKKLVLGGFLLCPEGCEV